MLDQYLFICIKMRAFFSRHFFRAEPVRNGLIYDLSSQNLAGLEICKLMIYQILFITVSKNVNAMPVTLGFLAKIVIWDTTRARKINLELFANLATVMAMPTSVIP